MSTKTAVVVREDPDADADTPLAMQAKENDKKEELLAQQHLGKAAERFARLMLQHSAQTKTTYMSSYRRFNAWLIEDTDDPNPPPSALTADRVVTYIELLEKSKAPATVKKERAAINRLARYMHTKGWIDATEILMIEGTRNGPQPRYREALDEITWRRVKDVARGRLHQSPRGRTSTSAAWRDLALILVLGEMGLRSEEARVLLTTSIRPKRVDGITPWLTVHGKGDKTRELPIPPEVADVLLAWLEHRNRILPETGILFPRLGREREDGTFPAAGPQVDKHGVKINDGRLSARGLTSIVKPVMLAAGVPKALAHPHVLRHTYGTLFMRRDKARIEQLQVLMGHVDISTTTVYVHHSAEDLEAAVLSQHPGRDILAAHAQRRRSRVKARNRT